MLRTASNQWDAIREGDREAISIDVYTQIYVPVSVLGELILKQA
jgi:hypothetical protein